MCNIMKYKFLKFSFLIFNIGTYYSIVCTYQTKWKLEIFGNLTFKCVVNK